MAKKIKKKELAIQLGFEKWDNERQRYKWLAYYGEDPDMDKVREIQMAFFDGMKFAYEHLMEYYGLNKDLAD